jgi:murein DD-endopeptidase MepM/ murein hydrolase activator NlpD
MRSQVAQLNQASSNLTQSYEALLKGILEKKSLLAATPTLIPADGWYSSRFGYRRSPFTKRREFHKGLDIAARKGTPIVAPADGRVIRIGRNGSLGLMMVIDHGHGFVTRYGHIQNALKSVGDFVKRGDQIARVGDSGRTTGPHLHYEVIVNNRNENPENYILN